MDNHILINSEIDEFLKEVIEDIQCSGYTIKEIISFLTTNALCFPKNNNSEMRIYFNFKLMSKTTLSQKKTLEIEKIFNDNNFDIKNHGNWEIVPTQTLKYIDNENRRFV